MLIYIASSVKIPCYLLKLSSGNENMGVSRADNSVKIWRNLPISNPKPDLLLLLHIASLVKIPCYLLKLSSGNENMGVSRADNSAKIWRNLPICNPKPDLHNINAQAKFGENPFTFTQVIIRKRKTDGRTTDGHTDDQRETIIPHHYCVAGYKNVNAVQELKRAADNYFGFTKLIWVGVNEICECSNIRCEAGHWETKISQFSEAFALEMSSWTDSLAFNPCTCIWVTI